MKTAARYPFTPAVSFTFEGDDFAGMRAAEAWCHEHGFSYGSHQADAPTALFRGDCDVSKWRNLSTVDKGVLDGVMDAPGRSYRSGPVYIHLRNPLPEVRGCP